MPYDKIDQLYDALKKDGAVSKSREYFRSKILAPGKEGYHNRLQLYNALKADGAIESPTYEEFGKRLGLHAVNTAPAPKPQQQKPQATAPQATAPAQQKPYVMSEQDKIRLQLQMGQMKQQVQQGIYNTNAKIGRMMQPLTPKGRERRRSGELQARVAGTPTSVVGFRTAPQQPAQGGGNGAGAASQDNVHSEQSPQPYGVVYENGKAKTQWVLADGSLTTSLAEANQAEYEARTARLARQFQDRMKENGLDPNKTEDVQRQAQLDAEAPMRKVLEEEWQRAEAEDRAADEQYRKDKERAENGSFWDRLKNAITTPLGPDGMPLRKGEDAMRDIHREAKRQDIFNLDHIAKNVFNNLPQAYKGEQILNYSRYFREHPSELKGRSVAQAAKDALQNEVYQATHERAVKANMPKSKSEFFMRKVMDQPFFSQNMSDKIAARTFSKSNGTETAEMDAMGRYGSEHRALDITGTIFNMGMDPTVYFGGYVGSVLGKQVLKLGGKVALKGAAQDVAERYVGRTLAGRMAAGMAAGSANFGTFEGLKNIQQQMRIGGTLNPETGEYEFSAGDMLKATGHGMLLGSVTGTLSPVLGNVSDKLVKATEGTAGKVGIRAGELMTSTVAEGTIFATPELIENAQLADNDPNKRKAMDIWTDNMAMMLGFKLSHGIKSVPQVIAGLRPVAEPKNAQERMHNNRSFVEKVRKQLDASPRDLDFTKDEREELQRNGYGDLASLFTRTPKQPSKPKPKAKAKPISTDGKVMYLDDGIPHAETERVSIPEFDGYETMERLMQDPNVSQSARAKAYYILTGRMLPMGTITGYSTLKDETGITVRSMTADGQVVTSRKFDNEADAKNEEAKIRRQSELNSIDVGERYKEASANQKVVQAAIEEVAPGADLATVMRNYKAVKEGDKDAIASYGEMMEQLDKAIEKYRYSADNERPEAIRESIKEQTGIDVDKAIRTEPEKRTEEEAAAVEDYIKRLFPEQASEEKPMSEEEATAAEAYDQARLLWDKVEKGDADAKAEVDAITLRMQEAYQMCEDAFGADAEMRIAEINEDPWPLVNNPELSEDQQDAVLYYVNAKAAMEGVMDASNEAADGKRKEVEANVERHTHKDMGVVLPATMKVDDKPVYVVKGNVVMLPDGSGIDVRNSDQSIVICDAETGEYKFASPDQLFSLGEAIDPQTELDEAYANIQAEHEAALGGVSSDANAANEGGGQVEAPSQPKKIVIGIGSILKINGEEYRIDNFGDIDVTLRDGQGNLIQSTKSEIETKLTSGEAELLDEEKSAEDVLGIPTNDENVPGNGESVPNSAESVPQLTDDQLQQHNQQMLEQEQQRKEEEANHQPTALERVPINEATQEPMFEKADRETALDALNELTGGNEENTSAIINAQVDQATKALETLKKKAPKKKVPALKGSPMEMLKAQKEADDSYNTAIEEYNAQVAAAEENLNAWTRIYSLMGDRKRAAREQLNAERNAMDEQLHAEAVAKLEEDKRIAAEKAAEQAEVGTHAVNPKIKGKWDGATKVEGNPNAITLADGSTIRGHYVLTEAGAATASHDVNNAYEPTEGFPVDENGESVNDRDYKRDTDAQRIVRDMADSYDSRALQTPVIVSKDGVVLSGNNRTMSGEIAAKNGTDNAYVEHLREFGTMYGFTPEQIDGMQHPRIVFVPDEELPYDASTFARFNAEQQKKQSKPEHAVKLGKIVPDNVFASIVGDISRFDHMSDYYADGNAVSSAIGQLLEAGVINEMQLPELRTGNALSAAGKELIENTLIGKVFQASPDAVRQIISTPTLRQSVVMGLNEIANNRTLAKSDYDLSKELAAAVDLVNRAKSESPEIYKEGMPVSPYGRQQGLFDDEYGDSRVTDGVTLILADILNSGKPSDLRKFLSIYNNEAASPASGQLDMFSGGVTSKEELLNRLNEYFRNATPKEQQAIVDASVAERKQRAEAAVQNADGFGRDGEEPTEATAENGEPSGELDNNGRLEERRAKILSNMGDKYSLSEEHADNGEAFIQNENGSTNLAKIPDEIFDRIGISPVPFKLTETMGWHVFDHHGKEAKLNSISDAVDFVLSIVNNVDHVRLGRDNSYIFSVENNRKRVGRRAVTIMINSKTGEFMGIRTSGYETLKNIQERPLLWERGADAAPEDVATPTITTIEPQQGDERTSRTKGQSNVSSYGKVINKQLSLQENGEKSSENESEAPLSAKIEAASAEVNTEPTEAQKEAGNYKKGHVQVGTFDITIEQPQGSVRKGTDANGKQWESKMNNTYGYIRGAVGVDGDHIDVFLSNDIDGWNGRKVFVVDQYNPDGSFDEHKVMLGFNDADEAKGDYLSNYEKGWENGRRIDVTAVNLEDFEKWIESSKRKTKPFGEYKSVKSESADNLDAKQEKTSLTDEEVMAITDAMKANAVIAPTVEINDANWKESVDTPIGTVKMGENQKAKLFAKGREQQYGMLLETLSNPNVVLEEKDKEQNLFHERPSSYLFVKTFQKEDGSKFVHFESVTVSQDGMEVSISSHIIRENQLKNKLKSDRLLYKATALDAPANTSAEQPIVGGSHSSDGKGRDISNSLQENDEKSSENKGETPLSANNTPKAGYTITPSTYTNKKGKTSNVSLLTFDHDLTADQERAVKEFAKEKLSEGRFAKSRGWKDRESGGWMFRSEEDAHKAAEMVGNEQAVADNQPMTAQELRDAVEPKKPTASKKPANRVELADVAEQKPSEPTKAEQPKQDREKKLVITDEMKHDEDILRELLGIDDDELDGGMKFRDPDAMTSQQRRFVYNAGVNYSLGYIDQGFVAFPEFAKAMVSRLGYKIKPWLKSFYEGVKRIPGYDQSIFTPTEEVDAFDVENFDKPNKDVMAQANMIVEEGKAQVAAEKANNELKEIRNEQRKETEKQTAANTDAVGSKAKSVASEATSIAETSSDEQALAGSAERVDETLDKVNEQLAILGYYEADEVEKDYNESYGYMRNAEKKAVKDVANLASQLIDDLGLDRFEATHSQKTDKKGNRKKKPLAVANIAPIGGDVYMRLPLAEGRELYLTIGVEPRAAKGVEDFGGSDLEVTHIMFRVENPESTDNDRYGRNEYVGNDVTYSELLDKVQREVYKYIPERTEVADGEYKVGDKVQYSPDGGRTWEDAVVAQPNDEGGIRIDTGLAPVLWVNAHLDQLRHKPKANTNSGNIADDPQSWVGRTFVYDSGDTILKCTYIVGKYASFEDVKMHYNTTNEVSKFKEMLKSGMFKVQDEKPTGPQNEDIFQKAERIASENRDKRAKSNVEKLKPIGKGAFGDVYNQFQGNAQEAFAFLKEKRSGDILGVFRRDDVGDIDVVWGDKGGGLSHIIDKHVGEEKSFSSVDEAAKVIDDIIKTGDKAFENGDKIVFKKGSKLVTIRKNVRENGKKIADKNWILTAYDELSADGDVSAIAPNNQGQAARTTDNSRGKGTGKSQNSQKKTTKKVKPEQPVGDLFAGLFDNTSDNGLQGNDEAVRTETVPADHSGQQQGLRESQGSPRKAAAQKSGRPDGRRGGQSTGKDRAVSAGLHGLTEPKNTRNNHSERGADHAPTSVNGRIEANIKAIELAHELLESGEAATPEQMSVLRQFSGWGGLGAAFSDGGYDWKQRERNKKIRELLGEEAYEQAVMSANSAYYTPAYVVDTLWDIANQLGFKGGNILEGSAGIGNILGQMPTMVSERSNIHAIEIDGTSGGILSLLYPDAKVDIQGFEQTRIPNGSVDLAITNVPFVTGLRVNDTTGDSDLSKKFHNIHDFCIAKNVRKLREGGLGIFISSNGTLDNSKALRDWVVNEGGSDFIGAFRMNNKTFGGTTVTSDIIVIRKRVNGQKSAQAIDVSSISGERTAEYEEPGARKTKQLSMDYNKYFIEHPDHMAGEMRFAFEKGDTFRPTSKGLYPVSGKDQGKMLADFVKSFTEEDNSQMTATDHHDVSLVLDASADGKRLGEMYMKDGQIVLASFGGYYPLEVNDKKIKGHTKQECFTAYAAIKTALADVMKYQTENEDNEGLKPLIAKLNKAYDSFVSTFGHFTKNNQLAWLRNDVDYPNVFSLETYKEQGDGKGGVVKTYDKADVMKGRVVEKEIEPHPENVKDGVVVSMFKNGRIDVPYIASQLGKSEAEVKREIIDSGLGFEDPTTRQMEVSYQYLSGNVREKLKQAEANNENGEYNKNIKALQDVVPMNIPAHLIDFTLGSSWIDPKLYDEYVKERTDIDVHFTAAGGTWFMKAPTYGVNVEKNRAMGIVSEMLKKIIMGHELIEAAIQNKSITVSRTEKHYDGTTETITDREAMAACAAKIDEIRQDFKDWARGKMQRDADLSARMEQEYNDRFNNYVPMSIPEDFVPEYFGGATHKFKMRPHQGKAIVRGTMQPLMLAHEVGTGKTFTLISTAMEMRRLGTARKPMIVVQNATVGQFAASAKKLYPNAKVLVLDDNDRDAEGRKNFYAKIKYNDWDMVIIPQSTLDKIPDSDERQMQFVQDKIDEKMRVLEQMREADTNGKDPITRRAEKELADLQVEMAELSEEISKKRTANNEKKKAVAKQNAAVKAQEMLERSTDDVENFDDMGIDALLIDEAHEYKHLGFSTAMQRGVKGVDPSYSKKSQGVYLKTQAILEKNNGRNVIFATGTPISNTAAEIWTFMRYLMPKDTMKEYGIYYFDDFVRNFGNIQQMPEFKTNGKFKEVNRFAGYVNLPELVRIWSSVSDTALTKDQTELVEKIPEMEGGKAQDIYLSQTRALRSVMKYVRKQLDDFEQMSGKEKKENSSIPLTMYGIAQRAAVDARLVQVDAEDDPRSKTNEAVRQTLRSLKETNDYKGTVAIFADSYENKYSGFNLYEDIKKKLVKQGIPESEIVVMKSGMKIKQKLDIFDKVNRGEVRVILGSTATLGTGVNIQERLHTLIHLDAPNRPMDYTQRNGRILRQGNLHKQWNKPVRVLRFGVEDSLDVTAYQRLKTKGAIADSVMEGDRLMQDSMNNRVLEEEEDVFGDTVAQLSGSEYALLKNNAEKNVRKYESRRKQWEADQVYIHYAKPRIEGQIEAAEQRAEEANAHLHAVQKAFPGGKFTEITVGKLKFASVDGMADFIKEHNKKILDVVKEMKKTPGTKTQTQTLTLSLGGYDFVVKTEMSRETVNNGGSLFAEIHRNMSYSCPELGLNDVPVKQSLLRNAIEDITENVITGKDFAERVDVATRMIQHDKSELEQVKQREGKPFEFEKELEEAKRQFEEYSEAMKVEMAEKEKKYAEMDASVDAATDVVADDEDEADDGNSKHRMLEDDTANVMENDSNAMVDRVTELSERLHTPVRIIRTEEEVAALPSARQRRMKGSFNPLTGEVTIVVPNNANMADIENTFVHEVVGHDGLRVLFPDEAKLNNALDELYRVSNEGIQQTIDRMAQKMYDAEVDRIREKKRKEHEARGEDANASYYADMAEAHAEASKKREQFKRDATEEYGADLAGRIGEKGFEQMSAEELTFWGKLKAMLQKALQKLLDGLKILGKRKWSDKDWAFVLHEAYKRKKNGGKPTVFDAADTEVMRRKTGFGDVMFSENRRSGGSSGSRYIEDMKQKVEELFEKARTGEFVGKPASIGRLSADGKVYLEQLSGLHFKEYVDFVLNPSDLNHIRADHYGQNEKDKGNNIPLTDEDIQNMVDVLNQPDGILYGIDKNDGRKLFFFLRDAGNGLYNLTEVCSTKKGNLTAKSFFKSKKKGISQRVMEIKDSLLPTSVTYSGEFLSSDAKIPTLFEINEGYSKNVADEGIMFSDGKNKTGEPKPIGHSTFGSVYNQFKGKVLQAVKFLLNHESGDLLGVFHRNDVGDIDMVWGDEGGGLCHILNKHINDKDFPTVKDLVSRIEDIINKGEVDERHSNADKLVLVKDGYLVTIRRNVREKGIKIADKNWVLTAYNKDAPATTKAPVDGTYGSTAVAPGTSSDAKLATKSEINEFSDNNVTDDGIMFRDGDMGLEETITKMKVEASQANADNWQAKKDAMRAIGGNLSKLRSAMSRQRDYDLWTIKSVTDLAQILLDNGLLDDMSKYEYNRILSAVKNVHGRKDISKYVDKVMDIMIGNQLRAGETKLGKLERIRGSRVDARGIEVQGKLDADGEAIIKAYRKAKTLTIDELNEKILDATDRMSNENEQIAANASIEHTGLLIAKEYIEGIIDSKKAESQFKDEIKKAEEEVSAGQMSKKAFKQFKESIDETIKQLKIGRIEAYNNLVDNLCGVLSESVERAKQWKESEKDRVNKIHHLANSDMQGRELKGHRPDSRIEKFSNNPLSKFFLGPLTTFDQMLKMFGSKNPNGEGYLQDYFMRKWIDATDNEQIMKERSQKKLDEKASEIFGTKTNLKGKLLKSEYKYLDLYDYASTQNSMIVKYYDGASKRYYEISQDGLMYLYAVDKMPMGKATNRRMGITDEVMENITKALDPKLKEFVDWVQEEFLPEIGSQCDEVYMRMFGTHMDNIENYFPFVRDKKALNLDVENGADNSENNRIGVQTGAIKKRVASVAIWNLKDISFLDILAKHVNEMNHWQSFAELNRDIGTLLSYKRFRQQVENMNSVYGSGERLWKQFSDCAAIATNCYKPSTTELDKSLTLFSKGVAMSKIALRVFTAFKQTLSLPAFFGEVNMVDMSQALAMGGIPAVQWSWKNMPNFRKRILSRTIGDYRLSETEYDNKVMKAASYGMLPNMGVDAWTIAVGSYCVYKAKKRKYLRWGMDEDIAEHRAIQDAELCFNKSQQSSEGAFMAPIQKNQTYTAVSSMLYRNSATSYTRETHNSARNLIHLMSGEVKEEFVAKQILRTLYPELEGEWTDEQWEDAMQEAKREIRSSVVKNGVNVAMFGWILPWLWRIGSSSAALLLLSSTSEKKKIVKEQTMQSFFGPLEGITYGDVTVDVINKLLKLNADADPGRSNPFLQDFERAWKGLDRDWLKATNDVVNILVSMGTGVNPQTITDWTVAIMDYCGDDARTSRECALLVARILSCPQSQLDSVYMEELDLTAKDASKLTPAELAKRYARYKMMRETPFTGWMRSGEQRDSIATKKGQKVLTTAKEKLNSNIETEQVKQLLSDYDAVAKQETALSKIKKTDRAAYREGMKQLRQSNDMRQHMRLKRYKHDMNELTSKYLRCKSAKERDSIVSTMFSTRAKMLEDIGRLKQQ